MVDAGVMAGVDRIISAHVMSTEDTGQITVLDGPALASSDRFVLKILGKGGHAANPDRCIDPVWIASQVVANLQAVVARNTDPHQALIVSVTRFHAGEAFNVIPDTAELGGSVRCFSDTVRQGVPGLIERIAQGVAIATARPANCSTSADTAPWSTIRWWLARCDRSCSRPCPRSG